MNGRLDRRRFMQLTGAGVAAFGLDGCVKQPPEDIVAMVREPEYRVPGRPTFYATTLERHGYGVGVLVETHEGRPTKIEGNPLHPASAGATDAIMQGEILSLYDPDRSRSVRRHGQIETWEGLSGALDPALERARGRNGRGLAVLVDAWPSPTGGAQLRALAKALPEAGLYRWSPPARAAQRAGAVQLFGDPADGSPRFDRAEAIVCVEVDPFTELPGGLRHARDWAERRRLLEQPPPLFVAESSPTLVGARADRRRRMRRAELPGLLVRLARACGVGGAPAQSGDPWADDVGSVLRAAGQAALVLVGPHLDPVAHAVAWAINSHLGATGHTLEVRPPVEPQGHLRSREDLFKAVDRGEVEVLIILGVNPVYDHPGDGSVTEMLEAIPLRVHHGTHFDETARWCHWHLPEPTAFEAWSDALDHEGTPSIVQPVIRPLVPSRSRHGVLDRITTGRQTQAEAYDAVRGHWLPLLGDDESRWRRLLHDGAGPTPPPAPPPSPIPGAVLPLLAEADATAPTGIELTFALDPHVGDGRYANNPWLQELPKPMTKMVWGDAARLSPRTAERIGVRTGDVLRIERGGGRVEIPAWVLPGQADDSIRLHLGHGRTAAGTYGNGVGVAVHALRAGEWAVIAHAVTPTGEQRDLVTTQEHSSMEGRPLVRVHDGARVHEGPAQGAHHEHHPTLYPPWPGSLASPEKPKAGVAQWGMAIDLDVCLGCNACTIACQAENNIPSVGADQVSAGRVMHWIRVDRYYEGPLEDPLIRHQPVPCMHCETAPCEVVCPTYATVHGPSGLNEMVYNRCVGTRYCSNNCPYKVRRFNFFAYADASPLSAAERNPDVTVRERGVMEKCTYCIQRIKEAERRRLDEPLRDGDVVPACAQACPTRAIRFGDLALPESDVSRHRASPRHYLLLGELGTRPRTSYLALRPPRSEQG